MTLPKLTPLLDVAAKDGRLLEVNRPFIQLHVDHLLDLQKEPSKKEYDIYCSLIVEEYKCFKDPVTIDNPCAWV